MRDRRTGSFKRIYRDGEMWTYAATGRLHHPVDPSIVFPDGWAQWYEHNRLVREVDLSGKHGHTGPTGDAR